MSSAVAALGKRKRAHKAVVEIQGLEIDEEEYHAIQDLLHPHNVETFDLRKHLKIHEGRIVEFDMPRLTKDSVRVSHSITTIFASIQKLQYLEDLNLSATNISSIPCAIMNLKNLRVLRACFCKRLTWVSDSIGRLQNLEVLDLLMSCNIDELPEAIGSLSKLRQLCLSFNMSLPRSIWRLNNLAILILTHQSMTRLPDEIGDLTNLRFLCLVKNNFQSLPPTMGRLKNLQKLQIHDTKLTELPQCILKIASLTSLNLSYSSIPPQEKEKAYYAVACNRARERLKFPRMRLTSKLLENGTKYFSEAPSAIELQSDSLLAEFFFGSREAAQSHVKDSYTMGEPDAIFRLLVDGLESLVSNLINLGSGVNLQPPVSNTVTLEETIDSRMMTRVTNEGME